MKIKQKLILFSVCLSLFFSAYLVSPVKAGSASLYLSPPSGTFTIGSSFSVKININSGGEAINASEGTLIFNPDEISVVSLSKNNSIFTLWTTEPTFSNSSGNIIFGGGTSTGFTGTSGTVLTATFKAKANSSAQINFSSGSILAADGKGTNILSNMNGGVYTINPKITTPPATEYIPPVVITGTPIAPIISSTTHSNPNQWYSNNNPKFSWATPSDIIATKLLIGRISTATPSVSYIPPISEKNLEDLSDGIWYFHVRLKNNTGWGKISHFKFQIDTIAPLPFEIKIKEGKETTNPQPTLILETTDGMSGIDYYEIKIDQQSLIKTEKKEYKIPIQSFGEHTIIVKAIDMAGNSVLSMTEINILPIETPIITNYSEKLLPNSILSIKGTAIPKADVKIYIQKNEKEIKTEETKSDEQGKWYYIETDPLEKGVYQIWAETIDSFGAKSTLSEKITIQVAPPTFLKFGATAISYLIIIITLTVLIAILIGIIFYIWRQIFVWKKKLKKETTEADEALFQAFKALKEETEEQIAKLDGKPGLSNREKKICNDLKKSLKISEKFISKEIKDIEKELE